MLPVFFNFSNKRIFGKGKNNDSDADKMIERQLRW